MQCIFNSFSGYQASLSSYNRHLVEKSGVARALVEVRTVNNFLSICVKLKKYSQGKIVQSTCSCCTALFADCSVARAQNNHCLKVATRGNSWDTSPVYFT